MSRIVQVYRATAQDNGDGQIGVGLAFDAADSTPRGAFSVVEGKPVYSTITLDHRFLDLNFFEAEAIVTVLSEILAGKADTRTEIPVYAPIGEDL